MIPLPVIVGFKRQASAPPIGMLLWDLILVAKVTWQGDGSNNVGQTDTWEYDPISDAWTQKASFPGPGRWAGAGFSINGKGYITVGFTGSSYPTSTFEFDPLTNNWISKAAFPTTGRQDVFSFEINNQGFVFGGYGSNAYINTLYRYDPGNDAWNLQSTLPSSGRDGVAGFVIGNTALYVRRLYCS